MKKLVPLFFVAACGGASSNAPPQQKATDVNLPQLPPPDHASYDKEVASAPALTVNSDELRLTSIDQKTYSAAQMAYGQGRLLATKRLLAQLVVSYPDRASLVSDFNAVQGQIATEQSVARASLDGHAVTTLAAPPVAYTLIRPANVDPKPIPKLTLKKSKKNEIIDDEKWFATNDVSLPEYAPLATNDVLFFGVSLTITSQTATASLQGYGFGFWEKSLRYLADDIPTWLPISYGTIAMTHAIQSAPYTIAIYGGRLLAVFDETKHARALFDCEAYVHPPANQKGQVKVGSATLQQGSNRQQFDITAETNTINNELMWALAKDHTVYLEHWNNGYAKDAKGQTGYLTALDLDTGELDWRSQPLVANSRSFMLSGGAVVTGYGFTAEPDFVYVLDAATGAVKQKTLVPSGPEEIVKKDDRSILMRTYDHDLTFDVR